MRTRVQTQGTALTAPSSSRPGLDILASGLGPLLPCPFAGVNITLLWHLVLPGETPRQAWYTHLHCRGPPQAPTSL